MKYMIRYRVNLPLTNQDFDHGFIHSNPTTATMVGDNRAMLESSLTDIANSVCRKPAQYLNAVVYENIGPHQWMPLQAVTITRKSATGFLAVEHPFGELPGPAILREAA